MTNPESIAPASVVIVKADRLYAQGLREATHAVFPAASIEIAPSMEAATRLTSCFACDLLITGLNRFATADVLEFLAELRDRSRGTRILVVTTQWDQRVLTELRSLSVHGVFDPADDEPGNFGTALRAVASSRRYWSACVLEEVARTCSARSSLMRLLTNVEQLVLAVIGDGSDDEAAARELGLSPKTVSTVRRDLHRKLGVQHRGELVRVAAQNGFVRFTPNGVVRPGFSLLVAAHRARRTSRLSAA